MMFSIRSFFSKCDQIRSFMRILSLLLKTVFMETSFFHVVYVPCFPSNEKFNENLGKTELKKIFKFIALRDWCPYSENTDQKNFKYRHFLRSED